MSQLPTELEDAPAPPIYNGMGVTTFRQNVTLTDVGGIYPIEPPIKIPAGGQLLIGDATSESFLGIALRIEFAVYVEGQRTHHYRLSDGRFTPSP